MNVKMSAVAVVLAAALLAVSGSAAGADDLSAPAKLTTGDVIALELSLRLQVEIGIGTMDSPCIVVWNQKTKKIEISFFGRRDDAESARESIETYLIPILDSFVIGTWTRRAVSLDRETQFHVVYYDRDQTPPTPRIVYKNGGFSLP